MSAPPRSEAREYGTEEVVVEWRPSLCFHSRNCVAALPLVFDPDRRPWIDAATASADEVESAVARCPSGALRARRRGGRPAPATTDVEVSPMPNGPLLVQGPIRVVQPDGSIEELPKAAFCRCGNSKNKPFCDGSHVAADFRA
jgi:uncharacterized Fe-S cluster protein YjdI